MVDSSQVVQLRTSLEQAPVSRGMTDFSNIEQIAKGGFGTVFRATHKLDGCTYAVKYMHRAVTQESLFQVVKEIRILSRLRHPNIVQYHASWVEQGQKDAVAVDLGNDSGTDLSDGSDSLYSIDVPHMNVFMQMEEMQQSVEEYIVHMYGRGKTVADLSIMQQIVSAVWYLHSQQPPIVHRDLKPSNILLRQTEQGVCAKICDFGLASWCPPHKATFDIQQGTFMYKSPEYHRYTGPEIDVYSLGLIFFQLTRIFSSSMERFEKTLKFVDDPPSADRWLQLLHTCVGPMQDRPSTNQLEQFCMQYVNHWLVAHASSNSRVTQAHMIS